MSHFDRSERIVNRVPCFGLQYDNGNRLTQKNYSDTTPTVKYGYDATAITGCTTAPPALTDSKPKGYRTAMCDGSGATSWNHDVMGRVLNEKRTIQGSSAITKTTTYTFNLDGSTATLTYPSGRVITYQLNAGGACGAGTCTAGRFQSAVDAVNSINYVTSATYTPSGAVSGLTFGTSIQGRQTYNSRLQPLQLFYTTSTVASDSQLHQTTCPSTIGNLMHRIYNFGLTLNDNGNVNVITNCRDTNRTQNFSYDALSRITQGNSTGTNWGETYTVDPWGNLTNRTAIAGKTNPNFVQLNAAPASAQNRLPGFGYDAAGNMTSNGSTTYSYDAESRLNATAGVTYTYDGDGNRVKRSNGMLYWMGGGSTALTETDLAGTATADYIFFNGKRASRVDQPSGNKHFYIADHLGSASVVTNNVGTTQDESDYYPYGGEMPIIDIDSNRYKFTGKERDTESSLDNFNARYMRSSLGRFITPDPLLASATIGDPQSWNRYSYALNNVLRFVDPNGEAPMDAILMDHLVNFTKWATPIVNQQADSTLSDHSMGRTVIMSRDAGAILDQLNFDTSNPFFDSNQVRGSVRGRLVDLYLHDLGNSVLQEIAMWSNLPSTTIADLEQALGHLVIVDDEKGEKGKAAKRVGDFVKYVPEVGGLLNKAARAISYGFGAEVEQAYQAYLRQVAEDQIKAALEKKKKDEEKKKGCTDGEKKNSCPTQ